MSTTSAADLIMEVDYDTLETGPITKRDGTPLSVDEMNRLKAATVADYQLASDSLNIRAEFGRIQASATALMVKILKANGISDSEVTGDVYARMSDEHQSTFSLLASIAFEAV